MIVVPGEGRGDESVPFGTEMIIVREYRPDRANLLQIRRRVDAKDLELCTDVSDDSERSLHIEVICRDIDPASVEISPRLRGSENLKFTSDLGGGGDYDHGELETLLLPQVFTPQQDVAEEKEGVFHERCVVLSVGADLALGVAPHVEVAGIDEVVGILRRSQRAHFSEKAELRAPDEPLETSEMEEGGVLSESQGDFCGG